MAEGEISNKLIEYWDDVTQNWSAEAKKYYYNNIFSEILKCSRSIYQNNTSLQNKSDMCLIICGESKEEY